MFHKLEENELKNFFKFCYNKNLLSKVDKNNKETVAFGKNLIFMKESLKDELDNLKD